MKRQVVITHPAQLAQLSRWPGMRPRGVARVRIETDAVARERADDWEKRLNRDYNACGCDTGSIVMLVGVGGYLAWLALRAGGLKSLGWGDLWVGLGVAFASAVVGKLVGLAAARGRIEGTIREIKSEWKAPPLPEVEPLIRCG
ncbi:MAG TPA: hypothetical protein VFX96_06860 [Pyrinomonadaceae bacterium]|nr:hypothetical protein [Pyrinomonadaceae bacterium]